MRRVLILNLMWHLAVIRITNTDLLPPMEERNVTTQHLLHHIVALVLAVVQALGVAEVVQVADLVNLRS